MKFSKLLTTAMMSVALVASSSAFAAEETPWWSMDFNDLTIAEGGSLTNTLNTAYGTTQNGVWSTKEGDLSSLADGKLVLNTQGTDLTWKPNGDNDTTAITYIDATVKFVGSDTPPTISETDVHTAVFLKNIVDDTTGEPTNRVLCAWVDVGGGADWIELSGTEVTEENEHNLRIMLDGDVLTFFLDDVQLVAANGADRLYSAKEGSAGSVNSVSFRGTGSVDYFAASQEEKVAAATASVVDFAIYEDNELVEMDGENWQDYLYGNFSAVNLTLNGNMFKLATIYDESYDEVPLTAIKVVSQTETFEIVKVDGNFVGDTDDIVLEEMRDDENYLYYQAYLDSDNLTADAQYTLEVYYGEYTPSEEPDPDPEQLKAPVVTATTTANSVTLTWTAVENVSSYEVTFINGTTTNVTKTTETTFTASDLTASTDYTYSVVAKGDGENYTDSEAATGTAKTAAAEVPAVEPDPIKISAISGPVDGNVVVTVVPAAEGGKIKAGVNYWAITAATLGGDETALESVTVDADTDSLEITVPATGDSLFIKVKAATAE